MIERLRGQFPWFFVIGAPKAATTTICAHLEKHPQVVLSDPKETDFFQWDHHSYERYLEHFHAPTSGTRIIGEGSPQYSCTGTWPKTPARIAEFAPDARIVYGVRHPLDRLRSYARQQRQNRTVSPRSTMFEVIRGVPRVMDSALYATQLRRYLDYFDRSQVFVYFFEEFAVDPPSTLGALASHLSIESELFRTQPTLQANASEAFGGEPTLLWNLRRFHPLRDVIPAGMRAAIRRQALARITTTLPADGWTPDAIEWVRSRIEPDVNEFLELAGRPVDYWGWVPSDLAGDEAENVKKY